MILRAPSTADWMLPPPEQEPGEFEQRWNVAPERRMPIAEAFKLGGMPGMESYGEADPVAVYAAADKAKAAEDRRARILASTMPGQTRAFAGRPTPHDPASERDRAMMEFGRDMLVPQTPLDVGLMVAGGPVGGKLLRGGAATLGALFEPDDAEAGLLSKTGKVLGGKPGGPHPGGIHVYHSSPHDFDKFDWSKLRTGEGANVYGSGFYFAENPAVSGQGGQYWDQFARNKFAYSPTPEGMATRALMETKADRAAAIAKLSNPKYQEHLKHFLPNSYFKDVEPKDALRLLESDAPVGPRTYEVNIAARPELMLDWDKPISKQPSGVVSALENKIDKLRSSGEVLMPDYMRQFESGTLPGSSVYRGLGRGTDESASEALREAGIPGIRYLDQGSRGGRGGYSKDQLETQLDTLQADLSFAEAKGVGKPDRLREQIASLQNQINRMPAPSYNYVVTDPSKLDILAKYGVVGGASLGVLAAQDRYQQ